MISADEFYGGFCLAFNLPAGMARLDSLAVDQGDPAARAASDALYETALETPALRFLVSPGNKWVQRALVIVAFAGPKAAAVRAELAARRTPVRSAANDNTPQDRGGLVEPWPAA